MIKVPIVIATDNARYVLIRIEPDGAKVYALASDVARGPKYARLYGWSRQEIEQDNDGPIVTEFELEIPA